MSKFVRMIDVLDLYSQSDTILSAEDIALRLNVSRPTAFRYARELSTAGFLANYAGRYTLGARIITLDYRIRESDPVLKVARKVMKAAAEKTGCGVVLCRMYNEDVINVHHEPGYDRLSVGFDRGQPLPLFRGSGSKIMLAFTPPARLKRVFEIHKANPELLALAPNWPTFKAYYAKIRQRGIYISEQEIVRGVVGIGAPITVAGTATVAAISIVLSAERLGLINVDGYAAVASSSANEIASLLGSIYPVQPRSA